MALSSVISLAIMMLQLMCTWSSHSINNSTYYNFLDIGLWLPLILVTCIVQNEKNQYIIPSVSSACNSHHIKIRFIMSLLLPSHFYRHQYSYFSLHQYMNVSHHSVLILFQETVEAQNWFTWVHCSICHMILSNFFFFRASCCWGRMDPGGQCIIKQLCVLFWIYLALLFQWQDPFWRLWVVDNLRSSCHWACFQ